MCYEDYRTDLSKYASINMQIDRNGLYKCSLLSDFINLTQVHNFTVSAPDIFTFRRLSVFTVSFIRNCKC